MTPWKIYLRRFGLGWARSNYSAIAGHHRLFGRIWKSETAKLPGDPSPARRLYLVANDRPRS